MTLAELQENGYFNLTLQSYSENSPVNMTSWQLTNFTSSSVKFKVTFSDNLYVSNGDKPDEINVALPKPWIFQAVTDGHITWNYTDVISVAEKQMRSEEEYEATLAQAESSAQAMWWMLIIFLLTKMLYTANVDAIFEMISFAQLLIFFQNFKSIVMPAPALLVFQQLYMMVNFSPDQYPMIKEKLTEYSVTANEFLERHNFMVLATIGLLFFFVALLVLQNVTENYSALHGMI